MQPHARSPQRATRLKRKRTDELLYETKFDVLKKLKRGLTRRQVAQQTDLACYTVARVQRLAKHILSAGEAMSMKVTRKRINKKTCSLLKPMR